MTEIECSMVSDDTKIAKCSVAMALLLLLLLLLLPVMRTSTAGPTSPSERLSACACA
jgi:hypothetical protein